MEMYIFLNLLKNGTDGTTLSVDPNEYHNKSKLVVE